eukprot:250360-Prymnesium_polylepis.1
MSPLHGRSSWRPASWGDRMTRSLHPEPVGIKPVASRGHEHYARVSSSSPKSITLLWRQGLRGIAPRSLVSRLASRWRAPRSP